jgi:hypothetical protein
MGLRIWLDDVVEMPEGYDKWITNAGDLADLLEAGKVSHISFDHDLGDRNPTGYAVALFIEQLAYDKKINPITWEVHSKNPVGRKVITAAMKNAEKFWYEE